MTRLGPVEIVPAVTCMWHPFAGVFPMLDDKAAAALAEDVKANGILEPVIQFQGMILDGRNRYMAAREAGLTEIPVAQFLGDEGEALAYVVSRNIHRRHLNESQRAAAAAKIATLSHGDVSRLEGGANLHLGENTGADTPDVTIAAAANALKVSVRSVKTARAVAAAAPELMPAVEAGKMAVSLAAKVVELPAEERAAIAAAPEPRKAARAAVAKAAPAADPARRELAKLSREALVDDVIGLRAENDDLRLKLAAANQRIAALTEANDLLARSDQGATISALMKQIAVGKERLRDAQAATKREEYKRKAAERAVGGAA